MLNTRFSDLTPLFYAVFDRIVPAANKYMATLFNTSASDILMVTGIFRHNWQVTGVAGDILEQYLARITARTAGTAVTLRTHDSVEVIPAGVVADTNSTVVTEGHTIRRLWARNEEVSFSKKTADIDDLVGFNIGDSTMIWKQTPSYVGIILRQNEGISIRNVTASAVGSVSYVMEFTQVY